MAIFTYTLGSSKSALIYKINFTDIFMIINFYCKIIYPIKSAEQNKLNDK